MLLALGLAASGPWTTTAVGNGNGDLPDLLVQEIYNITGVVEGNTGFFNVTIYNAGDGAYLKKTSGELNVYAYRDDETQVATVVRVYDDIYMGENFTVSLMIVYNKAGTHKLRVVIDEFNRVKELDEDNNGATLVFDVWPNEVNRPPRADGGNDRSGYIGRPMLFCGIYSSDPDDDELIYIWDFGDGTRGSGAYTNHTYTHIGEYRASLTVSDGFLTDMDNFTVTVEDAPVNNPPTAEIVVSTTSVLVGEQLQLDGSKSRDPDAGDRLTYDWDFDAADDVDDWVRGPIVKTSWSKAGIYTVTLRVSDGIEDTTNTVTITVKSPPAPNSPPRASAGTDKTVLKGDQVTLEGYGTDTDGTIVTYEWDVDGDGIYDTYSEESGTLVWRFEGAKGPHTLTLRVTDDRGDVSTDSVVVNVVEPAGQGGDSPGAGGAAAVIAICILAAVSATLRRGYWPRY